MSIGYEVRLTPLQILAFYNAIANDGKLVKPMFVKEIRKRGKLVKSFKPDVIDGAICSSSTIKIVKSILEGVVENGTATNLKNPNFKIAAKTGTAQIANKNYGYKYNASVSYQASLAGYFPADNPKYSCIVVVNAPSNNVYYGNLVAGPIFKEIAYKVYATQMDIHKERFDATLAQTIPYSQGGDLNELSEVFKKFKVSVATSNVNSTWVKTITQEKNVKFQDNTVTADHVPNVVGMAVKDAVYILENKGLNVIIQGSGMIKRQSLPAGTNITNRRGANIILELS
jgi:cell division protein FtsI (penicillin-binding protein 3)